MSFFFFLILTSWIVPHLFKLTISLFAFLLILNDRFDHFHKGGVDCILSILAM